jgi:hypothetical protein
MPSQATNQTQVSKQSKHILTCETTQMKATIKYPLKAAIFPRYNATDYSENGGETCLSLLKERK